MTTCPDCGREDETPGTECPHCDHIYCYSHLREQCDEPDCFIKVVRCINCGKQIKRGFPAHGEVRYEDEPLWQGEKKVVNRVHGERVIGKIDGKKFQYQCPICNLEHRFLIVDEIPIEPKPDNFH